MGAKDFMHEYGHKIFLIGILKITLMGLYLFKVFKHNYRFHKNIRK